MDSEKTELKLIIIGGGPTAFGALHQIYSLIEKEIITQESIKVIVLEKENEVGGLARSITDSNGFTWDLGIHVIGASRQKEFTEIINNAVHHWNKVKKCVKVDLSEIFDTTEPSTAYVPYPVQQSIPYFPFNLQKRCIEELKQKGMASGATAEYSNFHEYSLEIFGRTLQNIFIRPYNEKLWTVKLEEMSSDWVFNRIPEVKFDEIISQCGQNREELEENAEKRTSTWFRYPKTLKGFGEVWNIIAQLFPAPIFHLNECAARIDYRNKKVYTVHSCLGNQEYEYDYVLSTIPITELGRISSLCGEIKLKHTKVILVGIGLTYPQPDWTQRCSWVYYPYSDTIFYRCTFLSNFNDNSVPDADYFWSVLCEISLQIDESFDEADMLIRTIQQLKMKGVMGDETEVVDEWLYVLPFGYPIPTVGRNEELRRCQKIFQDYGLFSRGRFGGWKYEISNQDHSFTIGLEFINHILLGSSEKLHES